MDKSEIYIKMCWQAVKQTDIGEKWKLLSQNVRLGTFICFRSVITMIIPASERKKPLDDIFFMIPETLASRTWCDILTEDLMIIEKNGDFDDKGFPLFRQDQIQEMYGRGYPTLYYLRMLYKFRHNLEDETLEQIWLAFYMHEKHGLIWDGKEWRKEA